MTKHILFNSAHWYILAVFLCLIFYLSFRILFFLYEYTFKNSGTYFRTWHVSNAKECEKIFWNSWEWKQDMWNTLFWKTLFPKNFKTKTPLKNEIKIFSLFLIAFCLIRKEILDGPNFDREHTFVQCKKKNVAPFPLLCQKRFQKKSTSHIEQIILDYTLWISR